MNLWNDTIWVKGNVNWLNSDYLGLPYTRQEFNDAEQIKLWKTFGHNPRTGYMFDMKNKDQPELTNRLIDYVSNYHNLENVGVSFYKMEPGDNLPLHTDSYSSYIKIFNLEKRKNDIIRFIFFPENRKAGHIFEIDGTIIDWKKGDWVAWKYDTPHLAANLGEVWRYSIQVTGVLRESIK